MTVFGPLAKYSKWTELLLMQLWGCIKNIEYLKLLMMILNERQVSDLWKKLAELLCKEQHMHWNLNNSNASKDWEIF